MAVKIADKIVQMNNGTYPLMDASAVEYTKQDGTVIRVNEALDNIETGSGGANIDDTTIAENKVWSSQHTHELIEGIVQDGFSAFDSTYSSRKIDNDFVNKTDLENGYYTKTDIDNKGYLTEHQDLSEYAKLTDLHTHDNKDVLDLLTENDEGKLQYNGVTIGSEGGASTADAVSYVNTTVGSNNVEEALNSIIDKIYYVAPSITSFTASPTGGVFEIGTTISAPITFNWTYNKDITTQSLTDCSISVDDRTATYNSDITSNKTFTLNASDGKNNVSKSISYTFVSPYYVGVSDTDILDETGIKALTKKVEVKGNKTIDFTTSQSYMVFAYPSSYGNITKIIDKNGFDVTSSFVKSTVSVNSVDYYVYVSNKCSGSYQMKFQF